MLRPRIFIAATSDGTELLNIIKVLMDGSHYCFYSTESERQYLAVWYGPISLKCG